MTHPLPRAPDRSRPASRLFCTPFLAPAAMALGIFLLAVSPPILCAQQSPQFRTGQLTPILDPPPASNDSGAGFTGTEGLTTIPPNSNAFQQEPPAITPNSLFRNTQFPYGPLVTPTPVGPNLNSESVTGQFKLDLPTIGGGLPFLRRGIEPQDANLKIGPFYFKLREAEAAFIYSDNIYLTPVGQSGEIAYVGLTIDIVAQITETLRIATEGTLVYLPFQNQAGIVGFGLTDFYDFGLNSGPLIHAQATWETEIGTWHVVFADEFRVYAGVYSNDFRSNDVLFSGADFNDQAVAGRYVLEPPQGEVFANQGNQSSLSQPTNFRNNPVVYTNTLSATADRLLPGTVHLTARVYDETLWYNQGNRGLPLMREDGATISLVSERENMRFKPYFIYEAFSTNEFSGVQNIFRLGVTGPITDQLQLVAEGGYFIGGLQESGGLWRLQLTHIAGPYTAESAFYAREFNNAHDEIDEILGYDIKQILGPKLEVDAFAYRVLEQFSYTDGAQASEEQLRLGLRLTYILGPKTTLRVTGEYGSAEPGSTDLGNSVWWTGRAELAYNFTNTLLLHFVYQYQQSRSEVIEENYKENLFFLSLTKYFE